MFGTKNEKYILRLKQNWIKSKQSTVRMWSFATKHAEKSQIAD